MTGPLRKGLTAALLLSALPVCWGAEGGGAGAGFRWVELAMPVDGLPGFTLLGSERTGVAFTNVLDEMSSAANRVLENGSGVAIGDFDQDGWPDVFFCGLQGNSALYRNLGGWRFEDVTERSGLQLAGRVCRGAVFVDLDGDRQLDLLVSTLGQGVVCWRNEGRGTFVDVTLGAGTRSAYGSSTLALADIDGNGTLDLYVANYRADDIRDHSRIEMQFVRGRPVVPPRYRDRLLIGPNGLIEYGEPDILYTNDGEGHFTAVSWTGGRFRDSSGRSITQPPLDWGLTATFRDLNGDGAPDLYVCNDYWTPDRIWINDGEGGFHQLEQLAIRHTSENSMGVDFADIDRDGHVDGLVLDMLSRDPQMRRRQVLAQTPMPTAIGEFANRPQIMRNVLLRNRGDGTYADIADYAGVAASDWSWQPVFLDVDLDGYEDLLIPAGHTRDVQDLDATARIQALQHPWPRSMPADELQAAFTREMVEHVRLYPFLHMPVVAFRNRGNLTFEEVTHEWGTGAVGVHQGTAVGDLDRDGDLDLVVNNLNGVCGVYRNNTTAPRVAVRLLGLPPNSQGIGAKVTLVGGPVPRQSLEMVCGGRYLSGSESLLVFAAGDLRRDLSLEVVWRSGQVSLVSEVEPDRLYEIFESGARGEAEVDQSRKDGPVPPWFEDVSDALRHQHHEAVFDDFSRQPLLPRRLSQLGPGVGWYDLNGDRREDLMIGSGVGGRTGVYLNLGQRRFRRLSKPSLSQPVSRDQTSLLGWTRGDGQRVLLAGLAGYEEERVDGNSVQQNDWASGRMLEGIPDNGSSTGPLLLADLEGDGDLELFVGGRVVPGRYPEASSSRIYQWENGRWQLEEKKSRSLEHVGLVSGAVCSDLEGDGVPELVLACEWGPIRVFRTTDAGLREVTSKWGLSRYTGWWSGVTAGDIDGDGRLDLVAGNWGMNSPYRADPEHPLQLYYGDFMGRGSVDLVESEFDAGRGLSAPRHRLDLLAASLPMLRERFGSFKAFSEAPTSEVLQALGNRAAKVEATTLASMVFFNRGGTFEGRELPSEAQWSPVFGVSVADFDGDGHEDVFLSQNCFALRPEMHRLDAGRGLLLQGATEGELTAVPGQESGVRVYGEQRGTAVGDFDGDGRPDLVVTQNGAATKLFRNATATPGLRVRLKGSPENPEGIGACLRLRFVNSAGPVREIHAGSGYWSQDSSATVLATPAAPGLLEIRWPGGRSTASPVPPEAREIEVDTFGAVTRIE